MTKRVSELQPVWSTGVFKALVEHSLDVLTVLDEAGRMVYLSPSFTEAFGFEREVALHQPVIAFLHPEDRAVAAEGLGRIHRGEVDSERVQVRFAHRTEQWRHIEAVGRLWTHDGQRYTLVNTRDINDQKQLTDRLKDTNDLLGKMLQATRDAISITELETGRVVEVNEAWLQLAGFDRHEVIGRTAVELGIWGNPENRARVVDDLRIGGGRLQDYDVTTYTRHQGPRQLRTNVEPLQGRDSELILMVGEDRTERNLTEAKLRQAQRLEAVGQLTGGVAHDFNNLLGIILGNADILRSSLASEPALRDMAECILQAAERGANVTRQLLAFARRQTLDPKPLALESAMGAMMPLFRTTVGANIDIRLSQDPDLPCAFVDEGELEQAVLNLVVNARDAMPDGGELNIHVGTTEVLPGELAGGEPLTPGDYLALSVADNGCGMDTTTSAQIFEPFFTTKQPGQGTGLGMSMVFGFARQSNGHVRLDSAVGAGTRITLLLPPTSAPHSQLAEASADTTVPESRGETILILEDEPPLLDLLRRMLTQLGYRVMGVADETALQDTLASGQCFDLLISDVRLTGSLRGPELARRCLQARPTARVLFITGYADDSLIPVPDQPLRVLHKPFTRAALAHAVREALEPA